MMYRGMFDAARAERFMGTLVKLGFLRYARVDVDFKVSFASEDAHMLNPVEFGKEPCLVELCGMNGVWEVYYEE